MMDAELNERLSRMEGNLALLADRQRRIDDLLAEGMPILKEMMRVGTERLQGAEEAGYFRAGSALLGATDRAVRSLKPEELDTLGDDLVRILATLRALTRPDVLALASEAAEVVHDSDRLPPLGIFGLAQATGDADVQRGLAVMVEVLKRMGRAAGHAGGASAPSAPARSVGTPARAGRTVHKGLEALAPKRQQAAASCSTQSAPGPATQTIDGVGFTAEGYLANPKDWTPELGANLAAQAGITMSEAHWALVNFARSEFLDTGVSPNIRRLSTATGTATRDIYTLFAKAPGRTIARIAGVPKPAGCL